MTEIASNPGKPDALAAELDAEAETAEAIQEIACLEGLDPCQVVGIAVAFYKSHLQAERNGWSGPLYMRALPKRKGIKKVMEALGGALGVSETEESMILAVRPDEPQAGQEV
ncbi:MAG TPA: hypothetical protein VLE74_02940 [Candidatus Saccharimonadales bacterium]|nr:hypothetical protein [Candidatus Saccharimonadales bacterium]